MVSLFARSKQIVVDLLNGFGETKKVSTRFCEYPNLNDNINNVSRKIFVVFIFFGVSHFILSALLDTNLFILATTSKININRVVEVYQCYQ